jgi:hypothetical protein
VDNQPAPQTWLKQFLIIVGLSSVFAVWMVIRILRDVGESKPSVLVDSSPSSDARTAEARRAKAELMLSAFSAALRSRRYDSAWDLMAQPYRARHDQATLERQCGESALLSGLTDIRVFTTREQHVAGSEASGPDSYSARGVLKSSAGNVELVVHLTWELDEPRVMSLIAGGVPLLSGVSP